MELTKKPTKGSVIIVSKKGEEIAGETEFAAIVTKVYDHPTGLMIGATAFPPNGYTMPMDAVPHELVAEKSNTSWKWPDQV